MRTATGFDYLGLVTRLLQRARVEHPTAGLWEAADMQWWWRVERPSDRIDQLFWVDEAGEPVGAVVFIDWTRAWECVVIVVPSRAVELVPTMWAQAVKHTDSVAIGDFEVAVRDDDPFMVRLVTEAGFTATEAWGAATWMEAAERPAVTQIPDGYRLADRSDQGDRPHHMVGRSGTDVAARLAQTSLYRPDLDLSIETVAGDVVSYGLFWFDPVTQVGMVEPMRTEEGHEGKGLARHLLLSGLERLARLRATRLKVYYEIGNQRAERLYLGSGFVQESTVTVYARPGVGQPQ